MKRNLVALVCAAIVAGAIVLPVGIQNMPQPEAAVQPNGQASVSATDQGNNTSNDNLGTNEEQADPANASATDGKSKPSYEQGVVLVGLADGTTVDQLNQRLASLDYVATKTVSDEDVTFGYVELQLANGIDVRDAEARLKTESIIEAAQPNYIYHLADAEASTPTTQGQTLAAQDQTSATAAQDGAPLASALIAQTTDVNDPLADKQWALDAINAHEAWDTARVEGAVTVAVLDTGVYTSHEDLKSNLLLGPAYSYINSSRNVNDTHKDGHGTHVAGIIAATTNNNLGIAGISYNAKILPIQVMDSKGSTNTDIVAKGLQHVLNYASTYNVRVVNISIGTDKDAGSYVDPILLQAIAKVHEAGILVIYSAGNGAESEGGAYNCSPCDFDHDEGAIGVISVSQNGNTYSRSKFSNYNKTGQWTKDLSAPGDKILSTNNSDSDDEKYTRQNGTSFAAPYISGIAALMFAANPNLTPAEVRNLLCNTTQDLNTSGWDNETGYGLVNAQAAVAKAVDPTSDASSKPASEPQSLAKATVTLSRASYTYNGKPCKPTATVKVGSTTLKAGTDYAITYKDNVNAGTATATITGRGKYCDTVSKDFNINRAKLASMTLSTAKFTYDGTSKSPTATVRGAKNGKTNQILTRDRDYTLTIPKGRDSVGTYTYRAVGVDNYRGTVTAKLTIMKAANTMTVTTTTKSVAAKAVKKAQQKVRPLTVNNARGTVTYEKASGSKNLTINSKTGVVTVKKGAKAGTYTASVNVKAAGNSSYKAKTKSVKITVKVKK